jgi:lantibiotic modifying enzyme
LDTVIIRDARGTGCVVDPKGVIGFPPDIYLGAAHGISGVGHFLVLLAEASRSDRWAALARELLDTTARYAIPAKGGLNWPAAIGRDQLSRCQWSHGAPGIGLAFLDAYRVLGDGTYRETGLLAAEATYAYGDFRSNYTFCCGLASQGELLFKAYQITGDSSWKHRASEFALWCLDYREVTPEGDAWPTDTKGLHSPDYCYGAAGVGHFLLRVLSDGKIALPLY